MLFRSINLSNSIGVLINLAERLEERIENLEKEAEGMAYSESLPVFKKIKHEAAKKFLKGGKHD